MASPASSARPRRLASLAAIALLANPFFVLLGHTFMTDVPFLGFSLARSGSSSGLRARLERPTWRGLLARLAATFVRQLGLALLVGFAVATLVAGGGEPRRWLVAAPPARGVLHC